MERGEVMNCNHPECKKIAKRLNLIEKKVSYCTKPCNYQVISTFPFYRRYCNYDLKCKTTEMVYPCFTNTKNNTQLLSTIIDTLCQGSQERLKNKVKTVDWKLYAL